MKTYLLLFIVLLSGSFLNAQQQITLSKEEMLAKLSENNQSIKISQQEFMEARSDFRQTNALFIPNISISHTGTSTNNPVYAFMAKLNQGVFSESDFAIDNLNNPKAIDNFTTSISFEQPLINVDGWKQRSAAKYVMEATQYQNAFKKDELLLEGEKTYMMLQLSYKAVSVLEKAQKAALENLKVTRKYFEQGLLLQSDVLDVELRVNEVENQLENAKSNVKNVSDYLHFLINETPDSVFIPSDSLGIVPNAIAKVDQISTSRADILAIEKGTQAYKMKNQSDKMAFLPTLNAFGNYELYDNQVFQGATNSYFIGAKLNWDILQGTKRFGKSQKSKAELDKSMLQYEQYVAKSQLELNRAKRSLDDVQNKLKRAGLALELSEESFRIRTNRFEEGLVKTSDLLTSEAQYAQKQLEYYQTIYEYNVANAYVHFLTK
ncbi:MAG: transporter [Flavobacteriaceae bacterium CG_4_8_14_3_um_filter_34_10]|nr:MAG: transporter [Flavobacteriaceae bacterium CG18_big_fil_WC_8_21_14_2_50_34_36]PIX09672.1 MAG: transporter [Flavobacteriaceae bacterium CG_4_8_14_3_um_filter_34_10]PIZ08170.1 MAG: transporter [Flavobacteriaceae bacterium CG_4_10_14_0_8_um_filter_34_31]